MRRFFLPDAPRELPPEATIVYKGSHKKCTEMILVLQSQSIPCQLHEEEKYFAVTVPEEAFDIAIQQLKAYHRENRIQKVEPPQVLRWSAQPFWVLALPIFVTWLQLSHRAPMLREAGLQQAGLTLHGQWWRIITAQTLHSDIGHLLSNLVSGYFILALIAARIPLARVAPLLVIAAAAGNLAVALSVENGFRSLGYSSFVFAALGMLGSIEYRLSPDREGLGILRRLRPLLAVFLLAVFTGIGENRDVLGHFYGFAFGILAGFLPRIPEKNHMKPLDILGIIGYFGLYAWAWSLALQ